MDQPWYRKFLPWRRSTTAVADQTLSRARAGDRDAQFALGMTYALRPGAGRDPDRAREWLERAAEGGHVLAQFNLAQILAGEVDGPADPVAAERWLRRAAAHGDPGAQFQLGRRCQRAGFAAPPPQAAEARIEAYKWFHLAAAQGYGPALAAGEALNLTLERAELTEARRRAAAFTVSLPA